MKIIPRFCFVSLFFLFFFCILLTKKLITSYSQMSDCSKKISDLNGIQRCKRFATKYDALCEYTEKYLEKLVSSDQLLSDITYDTTQEEILSKIAVAKGQSITIYVQRGDYPKLKIVVPESNTTVLTLKKAIKRTYELTQQRLAKQKSKKSHNDKQDKHHRHKHHTSSTECEFLDSSKISWRWLWRTYFLDFDGYRLGNDKQLLSDCGIVNKSVLKFVKKTKTM